MASSTKNKSLKAFVKYDVTNRIIPMVLVKRTKKPDGRGWVEVPAHLCCSTTVVPDDNIGKEMKAFIKYDKKFEVVAGSTIVRKHKPKDKSGIWVEINYLFCCAGTTTTTTTTTTSSTTTSTTTTP